MKANSLTGLSIGLALALAIGLTPAYAGVDRVPRQEGAVVREEPRPQVWLFPDGHDFTDQGGDLGFVYIGANRRVTITISDGDRKIWSKTLKMPRQADYPRLWVEPFKGLSGTFQGVASSGGESYVFDLIVRSGVAWWVHSEGAPITWPSCSTVTWYYAANTEPAGSKGSVVKDFQSVLPRVSEATGITFTRVSSPKGASMILYWPKVWRYGGTAGVAELDAGFVYDESQYNEGSLYLETVDIGLNRSAPYALGTSSRTRVELLEHELAHAVGLMHVDIQTSIMDGSYSAKRASRLSKQELEAIAEVYRPSQCTSP